MMRAILFLLLTGLALAGCGQKGPLYLPGDAPKSQTQGAFGLDTQEDADKNSSSADQSSDADPADDTPARPDNDTP